MRDKEQQMQCEGEAMNTVIEFFDEDPIENLITCMNYQFDKVIYFGHKDSMTQERVRITRNSLKKICGITEVSFVELSKKSLERVQIIIVGVQQKERV